MLHARYQAVAVVYSDGSHWWADLPALPPRRIESYGTTGSSWRGAVRGAGAHTSGPEAHFARCTAAIEALF